MKSRFVKKLIAASLVTAMSVSMVACGENTDDAPQSSTSSEESDDSEKYTVITDDEGNPIDLGGIEVVIRDWWTPSEEEEPNNAYEEARQEYRDWIQETYNFTIKEMASSDWGSTPEDFLNYATSGGDEYYVFALRPGSELVAALNSGLMYDLSTLDCLDFSEEKWQANGVHEVMSKGDAIYGMRGIAPEPKGGIYFNKRLLEEAGITSTNYRKMENGPGINSKNSVHRFRRIPITMV